MTHFMTWLLLAGTRSSLALAISALVVWTLLWVLKSRSAAVHQMAWVAVLMQGWLLAGWPVEVPWPRDKSLELPTVMSFSTDAQLPVSEPTGASGTIAAGRPVAGLWEDWRLWVVAIWLLGIMGIMTQSLWRYWDFMRRLPPAQPAPAVWVDQWEQLLREQQVRAGIPLWPIERLGPLLCWLPGGYRLVIPPAAWGELSPSQRTAVLRHEVAHVRNRDVWKTLCVRLLALPHWFNPLAWWAVRRFDESVEWACDEQVGRQSPLAVTDYARALLSLGGDTRRQTLLSSAASGRGLVIRVRRLLSFSHMEDSRMKKATMLVLLCVLCGLHVLRFELAADEVAPRPSQTVSVDLAAAPPLSDAGRPSDSDVPAGRPAGSEAVVDVKFIFKNLPEFKRQLQELRQSIKSLEAGLQKKRDQMDITRPILDRLLAAGKSDSQGSNAGELIQ